MDPEKLTLVQRAARFIFLNKTCYNGLYRVNKNGEFNVPIGKYRAMPTLFDERNLVEVQRVLRRTDIVCDNYENVLQDARKDDLIYLDPPYSKGSAQAFVSYTKEPFSNYDQQKLAAGFRELDRRGCLLLLSNSDTDAVRDLYEDYADRTTRILADRSINSVGFNRTGYAEVLITNYTRFLETLTHWVK
jgi:DNA adenine methylase